MLNPQSPTCRRTCLVSHPIARTADRWQSYVVVFIWFAALCIYVLRTAAKLPSERTEARTSKTISKAYSVRSCPSSSTHSLVRIAAIFILRTQSLVTHHSRQTGG